MAWTNWADANNGVLIASENYKERDKNVGEERLEASEALWQSYLSSDSKAAGGPQLLTCKFSKIPASS